MSSNLYYLYPRLPQHIAQGLAEAHIMKNTAALAEAWSAASENAAFAPTGGNRITQTGLKAMRTAVLTLAQQCGYPKPPHKNAAREFDVQCAVMLYEKMHLHPSEASHNEVWSFLGCILLPDVVRWRFDDSDDTMHYVGRERGIRRHAFGRLWWRAYLARDPRWDKPYILFSHLNEDDFVQVTERSSIAVRPALFRVFCISFVRSVRKYKTLPRRDLMRDASKRVYRLLSLVAVEALSEVELQALTDEVFAQTAAALAVAEKA